MKTKHLLGVSAVLIIFLAAAAILISSHNYSKTALNEGIYQGDLKYDLTLDNIINKYSTNIAICSIISSEEYSESSMYKAKVHESLLGQTGDTIYIYAAGGSLLPDKKYLLFLKEQDSSLQKNIFYTALNEFILQICPDDSLLLLQTYQKQKYTKPFENDTMNRLPNLRAYIAKAGKNNIYINAPKKKVLDQASDIRQLISLSDHIVEISVLDCELAGEMNNIAIVSYDCYKKYKGGNFKNINKLLLPPWVEKGKKYLLFLADDEGSVSPATRKGSIIEAGTAEYDAIVRYLR